MRTALLFSCFAAALFAFTATATADVIGDRHWAVNIFGASLHQNRSRHYNEANLGLGVQYYFGDSVLGLRVPRGCFGALDGMRDSLRGLALSAGIGCEHEVFGFWDYHFSVGAELARIRYGAPNHPTMYGTTVIPGVSIRKKRWALNVDMLVPWSGQHDGVLFAFFTRHFK